MKTNCLVLLACGMLLMACSKPEFKGANYCLKRASAITKTTKATVFRNENKGTRSSEEANVNYIGPQKVSVALSRIVFPSQAQAQSLFDNMSNYDEQVGAFLISPAQYEAILPTALVAYNESTHNPLVITLDNEQIMHLDSLQIGSDERFWGMIHEHVYTEYEMEDFKIRWYANDCGEFKAKDAIIQKKGEVGWKFIYQCLSLELDGDNRTERYSIKTFDTRQENIFFWEKGNAGLNPSQDTLTDIAYCYIQDYNSSGSYGGKDIMMDTFGKSSTQEAGGGFGRLDNQIIGFTINVIYQIAERGESGTHGLMYNFPTARLGKMQYSDLEQTTNYPKQLRAIKSLEFEVDYEIFEY